MSSAGLQVTGDTAGGRCLPAAKRPAASSEPAGAEAEEGDEEDAHAEGE